MTKIGICIVCWIFCNPMFGPAQILLPKMLTEDLNLIAGENYLIVDSLWVPDLYKLSIPTGVQIEMGEGAVLIIDGNFEAIGSFQNPIVFKAQSNSWKGIYLRAANGVSRFEHCVIQDAKTPSSDFLAALSAFDCDVYLNAVRFSNNGQCLYIENSEMLQILNCQFTEDNLREHLNIRQNSNCLIDSCEFYQVNGGDAIDFDQVTNGVISNCMIQGGVDDGIDIGEESDAILIRGNRIFDCFENGITVGEESKIQVEHNLIVNCAKAIEAKDGGIANLQNNTLDQNDYGFAGFFFMGNAGGGIIKVVNTIVSNNKLGLTQGEDLDLEIEYSLSNSHFLPGNTNLFAKPHYQNPTAKNFRLKPISPCINQGDPASPLDPDNTRNDIGAFPSDSQELPIFMENFPNPFQQQTIFSYALEKEQQVELLIYDLQGRKLFDLINTRQVAGKHYYHWLTTSLDAGIYIYELRLDGERQYLGKAVKL